jgi:hypothetical protein
MLRKLNDGHVKTIIGVRNSKVNNEHFPLHNCSYLSHAYPKCKYQRKKKKKATK